MSNNKGNNVPGSWEDAADKNGSDNQPQVKKEKKPLRLAKNAQSFTPSSQPDTFQSLINAGFQPGLQAGFQPNSFGNQPEFQQYPGGFQPNYQPNYQQPNFQGGYQQTNQTTQPPVQTSSLGQPVPNNQNNSAANSTNNQPSNQTSGTAQPKQPTTTSNNTNKDTKQAEPIVSKPKEEAKKDIKKQPEPKVQETKKESKKGGKAETKAAAGKDSKGKKAEESKESGNNERSYLKLQNLIAGQKNVKADKIDLEAALKDKSKYDEIVDEEREPVSIVFIGHVDAGKSTTCGNILIMTGQVDQNEVRKLKQEAKDNHRESWWMAYLMDIGDEEKSKGITVEVGKARFNTKKKRMTILDAPGHKNYVPNMIAGASQADVAALVISAKTGEFESGFEKGGQTTEHAMLARSLGVQDLIILVNKMDENTINWTQTRFDSIKRQITPFLRDACGYDIEKNVTFIPVSGLNGDNIIELSKDENASWYKGPTFLELLDNIVIPHRDPEGPVRIPVLDKFKDAGALYIFGKVQSGIIVVGHKLTVIPNGESLTIHAIYNDDDKRVPYAKPGENVKLHIKNFEDDYINKGDIICSNNSFAYVCNEVEAEITITELPEHKAIMSTGYTCVIHLHSALEEIYIKDIKAEYSKTEDKMKTAKYLKSGSTGKVIIATKNGNPICCEKAEAMPHLGQFTLRDEGRTIASGKILRIKPIF